MRALSFTADDLQAIAHDRYHHPDPRVQRKMEVLWLKSQQLTHQEIAACAGVSRRTVQRYLLEYHEGGLDRLRRCRWRQPTGALTDHEASLEEYFWEHPPRSAKQARAVIEQQTGLRRVLGALDAVGHRLIRVTNEGYINAASVCALLRAVAEA